MIADLSLMSPFVNAAYAGYEVDPARWPAFVDFIARVKAHPAGQRGAGGGSRVAWGAS